MNIFLPWKLTEKEYHNPYEIVQITAFLQQINLMACFISVAFAATNK